MDRRTTLVAGGVMATGLGMMAPRVATRCATTTGTRAASTLVDDVGRIGASMADDAARMGGRSGGAFVDDAARTGSPRGVPAGAGLADDAALRGRVVWGPEPGRAALGRFGQGFPAHGLPGEHRLGDEVLQQVIEAGIDGTLSIVDDAAVGLDDEAAGQARFVVAEAPRTGGPRLLGGRNDDPGIDDIGRWPSGAPLGWLVTTPDDAVTVGVGAARPVEIAAVHRRCLEREMTCVVLACPESEEQCRAGAVDAWAAARDDTDAYGHGSVDAFVLRLLDELDRRCPGRLWVSQLRLDPDPAGSVERVVLELHPTEVDDVMDDR